MSSRSTAKARRLSHSNRQIHIADDDEIEIEDAVSRRKSVLLSSPLTSERPQRSFISPRKSISRRDLRKSLGATRLSQNELEELFNSCIKLSTENKINKKNTWSLNLIDHFHEVIESTLGEQNNFQVASCTLDASVKIYSYRVDSIHSEAYKVLGGLSRTDKRPTNDDDDEADGDDANAEDGSQNAEGAKKTRTKKNRVGVCTLENNISALNVKKLDLEYTLDPLYFKSNTTLDQGGAESLLLNNLAVSDTCEVILQYSQQLLPQQQQQQQEQQQQQQTVSLQLPMSEENQMSTDDGPADITMEDNIPITTQHDMIDHNSSGFGSITDLNVEQMQQHSYDHTDSELPQPMTENNNNTDSVFDTVIELARRMSSTTPAAAAAEAAAALAEDFDPLAADLSDDDDVGLFDTAFDDDIDVHAIGEEALLLREDDGDGNAGAEETNQRTESLSNAPVDPEQLVAAADDLNNDNVDFEYAYFDVSKAANWTGASHWKIKAKSTSSQPYKDGTKKATATKRKAKVQFSIDFLEPISNESAHEDSDEDDGSKKKTKKKPVAKKKTSATLSFEELFKAPKSLSTISLSAATAAKSKSTNGYQLPKDHKYDLSKLMNPFLIPNRMKFTEKKEGDVTFLEPKMSDISAAVFGATTRNTTANGNTATSESNTDADTQSSATIPPPPPPLLSADAFDEADDDDFGGRDFDDLAFGAAFEQQQQQQTDTQTQQSTQETVEDETQRVVTLDDNEVVGFDQPMTAAASVEGIGASVVTDAPAKLGSTQLVAVPKKVEKVSLNYARRVKKVDVSALKAGIWSEIKSEIPEANDKDADSEQPSEERQFSSVVQQLPRFVPPTCKLEEVSVPFCFICLLHLANEHGLEIKGSKDLSDCVISNIGNKTVS